MYVPGGAVSFQQGQTETLRKQRLLWGIPDSVRPFEIDPIRQQSTVAAPTPTESVKGWSDLSNNNKLLVAAGMGVVAGLALLLVTRKTAR